jgi:hypothetical protein
MEKDNNDNNEEINVNDNDSQKASIKMHIILISELMRTFFTSCICPKFISNGGF